MPVVPVFESAFSRIYGKPCWQVSAGHGSFLTLEFGQPHLEVREPIAASKSADPETQAALARRKVVVHGEWHLWIYCCDWEVHNREKVIGTSSTKAMMEPAIEFLDGQKLLQFSISPQTMECLFRFDLGAVLRTYPYDQESEQWLLYEPNHKVLVLRASGLYRHVRSDVPDDSKNWNRIVDDKAVSQDHYSDF